MRFPPADVVASWPQLNTTSPEVRGPALIVVEAVLISVATAAVALRLYTGASNTLGKDDPLGKDDFFIVIGWVCGLGLASCNIAAVGFYGWDRHIWDVPSTHKLQNRLLIWLSILFYILASTFTKISILLLYHRLRVRVSSTLVRWSTDITLYAVVAFGISFVVVLFVQCRPFQYYWHILLAGFEGSCVNEGSYTVPSMAISLVLDVVIFIIPLWTFSGLQMSLRKKLQLLALFSVGGIVVVAAAVRLYYGVMVYLQTFDVTWYGYIFMLSAAVEVHLGIICACVPACRNFFSNKQPRSLRISFNPTYGYFIRSKSETTAARSAKKGLSQGQR